MQRLREFLLRLTHLGRKELLVILKDPANRIILLMPVLVQSVLFGYAATYDLNNVPYAVLDQSHGGASTEILARLDGSGVFHRVADLRTADDIARVVNPGKALVVLQFPSNFERLLNSGAAAPLQLILDGRNSTTAGSASGYIASVVADYNRDIGSGSPITLVSRAWYNPNFDTRWNILPGLIAGLSLLQTLMLSALSVAREREQGTFDQLLVTPLSPMEIMIGKAVPAVLIGLTQASLILLISRFWFHIPMAGSLVTLYTGLLAFTIAAVGIGLSLSALSLNMQQAMLYSFVLIMPLMLLSGLTTPIENMPRALQLATYANPLRFAVDLVQRVYLEGAVLSSLWHDLIPLALISAVTLPVAAWMFRHRLT